LTGSWVGNRHGLDSSLFDVYGVDVCTVNGHMGDKHVANGLKPKGVFGSTIDIWGAQKRLNE
jgi:hypothetical protein